MVGKANVLRFKPSSTCRNTVSNIILFGTCSGVVRGLFGTASQICEQGANKSRSRYGSIMHEPWRYQTLCRILWQHDIIMTHQDHHFIAVESFVEPGQLVFHQVALFANPFSFG